MYVLYTFFDIEEAIGA